MAGSQIVIVRLMVDWNLPRMAASAQQLVALASERGVGLSRVLSGTGLKPTELEDLSLEISAAQELRLIENIVDAIDDPGLGLDAGSRWRLRAFGMLGFACESAPTLRHNLEISLRYQDLAPTLARAHMFTEGQMTFIAIDTSHLPKKIRHFVVDHLIAMVWAAQLEMGDAPAPPRVELARTERTNRRGYEVLFGKAPKFNSPIDRFAFTDTDLDRPRTTVDSTALRVCEEQCARLLADRRARIGITGLVRARLSRAAKAVPSMEIVAADLHMSSRHLRRALEGEGSSFRKINEEVRLFKAKALLTQGAAVQKVADELGYATSSSFVNAFRRWTGTTPGRHRHADTVNG
jgi:AraC-like DNA-binding protein